MNTFSHTKQAQYLLIPRIKGDDGLATEFLSPKVGSSSSYFMCSNVGDYAGKVNNNFKKSDSTSPRVVLLCFSTILICNYLII